MTRIHRPRGRVAAATTVAALLALAACDPQAWPNTALVTHSEFGRAIDSLWDRLLFWGTLVFVFVEALLLYIILRYRHREGRPAPKHVHGNTTLEIVWTAIPAVILALIAVPTVRTIFRTQAKPVAGALEVEVIGHQWWWEFRYPQYGVTTANELYLPAGRTVNFALKTADVIHSFWVPRLGGKRDLISNHTNFLWYTPDSSTASEAWNGQCAEYCGASHANMKFRTFTVTPQEFESWVAHQKSPAAFGAVAPPPAPGAQPGGPAAAPGAPGGPTPTAPASPVAANPPTGAGSAGSPGTAAAQRAGQDQGAVPPGNYATGTTGPAGAQPAGGVQAMAMGYVFPADRLPAHTIPRTPTPPGLTMPDGLAGDPARGQQIYSRSACIGCHKITGNPMSVGITGPDLTHIGSRHTLASGLFPNDTEHLFKWIKNARLMKPGALMFTLGKGEYDPVTKATVNQGGLTDQDIADIVAYLQALK
jgi:cytochrome c oxidase subunit 2